MKERTLVPMVLAALVAAGCSNQAIIPFLGKWDGQFDVEATSLQTTARDRQRLSMKGFLVLYATEHRFTMHLEGEQESFDSKGQWEFRPGQVVLSTKSISIDDQGGAEGRDPNKKWIPVEDLRKAYSGEIPLKISSDKLSLTGPLSIVGQLTGRNAFRKSVTTRVQ